MKRLANHLLLTAAVLFNAAFGQPASPRPAVDAAAFRSGMANARTRVAAGDLVGAEQAVAALTHAKTGSSAWHLTIAQRLLQTAEVLAREGKPVPALATRALQLAEQAEAVAKNARSRAAARSLAGHIQERFLGNRPAALAAYQGAQQQLPTATAQEAVTRLQQTENNLQAKQRGGGR